MRSIWRAIVIALAVAIGIFYVFRRDSVELQTAFTTRPAKTEHQVEGSTQQATAPERNEPPSTVLRQKSVLVLRALDGLPVEGAEIFITRIRRLSLCEVAMQYGDSFDAGSIVWRGVSMVDGTCELSGEFGVPEEELAVWIVKPGFEARCLELPDVLTSDVTTLYPDVTPQRARVIVGGAAAGSQVVVTQRLASVVFDTDSWSDATFSTVEVVHDCSELNPVRLLRYAGINNVQAQAAGIVSAIESASLGRDVTLSLSATFSVYGNISGGSFEPQSPGIVEYCVRRGAAFSVVARARSESNGSFRLAAVPVMEALTHSFRFVSDSAMSASVYIDQPAHGESVEVNLTAQTAQPAQFEVVGPSQLPIAAATVHVLFESGRNPREVLNARADMNGRATVLGLPSEVCIAYATAPGFFASATTPIWPQYLAGQTTRIEMREAGTISGRVLKNGQPIETFDIWYLSPEIGVWTAERFDSTEDGMFLLREVPVGRVEMYASADSLGQSDVVNVEVSRDENATKPVVIPLLPSMAGHGVAVDSISGKPLENARVQIWTCAGGTTVGFRSAIKVEPITGAFRTDALSAGTVRVHVEAVGYAGRTVSAFGEPGADVDFGVVRLDTTQALQLRLAPDGDLRLDFCSATVFTDLVSPSRLFDEAGWLAVGPVLAGPCRVDVVRADRYEEGFEFTLEPGQGVVELPVRVAPGVNVVLEEGAPAEAALVRVHHRDETGWGRDTLGNLDGGREVALPVEAARVREVEVLDASSVRLMRREVTAEERAAGTVRIGAAEELLVRVVDRKRAPIEGTTVLVRRDGGATEVALDARTDAEGLARLAGVGWEQVEVLAFHPQRGVVPSVRARAADHRSKPLEIELEAEGRWSIDVRDGEAPLAGVQVRFLDPRHNAGRSVSDAAGRATSLPFARGRFRAEAGERGYWPAALEVEFQGADLLSTLQVRRTGSAVLEVRSSSTPDVRDIELDLESLEFRERASDWIAAGKASADGGLQPDNKGRVRIDGLPRGKYRWRASRAGEVVASGELEVPPHGVVSEKLLVP